jgi:phenolic acid decarboxylase
MKELIGFFLVLIVAGCNPPAHMPANSLVGKTMEYRYGESVYHVTFDSDTTLHWEAMAGDETGTKENETYVAEWIGSQMVFITWGEANGIGVSQILDLEKGKVHNHLLRNRNASMGEGEIRIIEK